MRTQESEPTFEIDPLQPAGDTWLHAKAVQGDVQATIDIRPYPDVRYPGRYVLDAYYDRANPNAAGGIGRRQKERAKALQHLLRERVTSDMQAAGWRTIAKTPTGATIWHYQGPAIIEQEQQQAEAAARIWRGRFPRTGVEKTAPLAEFPVFRTLIAKRWYQVGEGLEICVDYTASQVQVRSQDQTEPAEPEQPAEPLARAMQKVVTYQRLMQTKPVTFVCESCHQKVTQQRYPGPMPRYCSEPCKQEAIREQTRARVQRLRAKRRHVGAIGHEHVQRV